MKNIVISTKDYFIKHFNAIMLLSLISSFLQYSYLHIMLNGIIPKFILLLFLMLLYLFNTKIYEYIAKELEQYKKLYSKILNLIIVVFLSLIMIKSFNLTLFMYSESILKIPAELGLTLIGFQNVFILTMILGKINLKQKNTGRSKYDILLFAIPSAIILVFLYLVYFPGQISADTVYVWTRAGQNKYNDLHPLFYMLLIRGLRYIWNNIAIVTLFHVLFSIFTFSFVANELRRMGTPKWLCWAVAIILPILPTNALYSVTIWKDVPYTLGLIILSMLLLKSITSDYYRSKKALPQIIIVSLFILFMRHNGLFSVFIPLFLLGVYQIFKKDKKLIIKTLIIGFSLLVLFFGIKSLSVKLLGDNYENKTLLSMKLPHTIQTQQIIYTQYKSADRFTEQETEMFNNLFDEEKLGNHKKQYEKYDTWMFYYKVSLDKEFILNNPDAFRNYYHELMKKYPRDMLKGYEKITSIMWATTDYGPTAYRAKGELSIEGYEEIRPNPIIKTVAYKLDNSIFMHRYCLNSEARHP